MNPDKTSVPIVGSTPSSDAVPCAGFLSGGGEMGRLVRNRDWSQTPLGTIETWPPSLLTTLGIVLNSRFPMMLLWGEELLCFYNDAFRPSLGTVGKHPAIFGLAARLALPENWHVVGPLLNQVMRSAEPVWKEDFLVPLQRNGQLQETYWTFSCSPVTDEAGHAAGVFVTCTETTAKMAELQAARSASQRFADMVMQAPVAIAVFRGPEFIAEIANDAYLPLVDKTRDEFIGKPMFESVPSVRAAIEPLVREVVRTGKSIRLQEIELTLRRHDRDETCWFNLVYEPLRETDGTVDGFMVTATEVTNQVLARRQAEQKEAGLRKARDQFELSIAAGNVGLWHWDAQNQALNWSRQQEALYGLPAGEFGGTLADFHQFVFPEDLAAMLTNPASDLAQSGEAAYEFRIRRTDGAIRWIQARSRTLYNDNGVLEYITGINIDITEQRRAEEALRESENRLRLALESANMGIHVWNIAENTLYWDDRLREMWDIGPDDTVTYELFVNGLHPEDRQKVQAAVNQALDPQGNGQYVAEYRVIDRKTAAIRWVLATGRVFFENGVPVRLVGTARDITERTEAEEKLRESENRFRVLAETLPQMVWMSEADGRTEYTSGRWKEYFGIEDSQQAWRTKVHPDDQEPIMTAWGKHFAAKLPFRYEVRLQSKDGGYRWHYSIAEPVKNEQGETVKWIGALTDIDDQKTFAEKLEREVAERTRELAAANDELTRSNHDLQQFAHVTSHDLQEPLRKIKVFTGLLQKESDCVLSAQGLLYLDKVRHATERVQAMIDGVLAYSKVRASGQNVEMVDLNAVVANACNDLEILIGQKNARIETEPLPVLAGSPVLLHQLFYNLIHNALKFSRPGVPPLVAVRSLPSKSETVTVEVRDNGIGFEPEYAERIFDTFVRLNPKDTYEGTGLGLALCKKIAQRHGGTIRATATLGQGAVFAVTLPLQQVLNVI